MSGDTPVGGAPPPGWYPDPERPGNRRWWDGAAWSDHSEPISQEPPLPPGSAPGGFQAASGYGAPTAGGHLDTWLWQSIVATILCCMPLGVAGIAFAAQAQTALDVGNMALAQRKSKTAKTFVLWSVGLGIGFMVLSVLFLTAGVWSFRV